MNAVYIDSKLNDAERRKELYHGQLFVYSPQRATEEFCAFARDLIREAFDPFDPELAQQEIPVEKYVEVLTELKPAFIHHPRSKEFIRMMLKQSGCDLDKTYFDVPRLRSSTSDNYLTSGIAYAFHPHRDTWYSAPFSQINWWMPVFEMEVGNGVAIHPKYWSTPVSNSSYRFAYSEWVQNGRKNSSKNILSDERVQPRAMEPLELNPQLRVVLKPGASLLFSAAHLHSSVPNFTGKTRFSIDFRTINFDDVLNGNGAPNIDSACADLTLGDFVRASDFAPFPKDVLQQVSSLSKPLIEVA